MTPKNSTESSHRVESLTHPSKDEKMVASQSPSLKVKITSHESENDIQSTESQKTRRSDDNDKVSGRERLKRHRVEVAGRVWIPDMWGQEELLKDWVDCTALDASLVRSNIMSARAALVEEGRIRANSSSGLRIVNRC